MSDGARDSLELARLHLDALYECDADDFITASRDAKLSPPRFHLVRTPAGNHWLLRATLDTKQRARLAAILLLQPQIADCADAQVHPPALESIRAILADYAPAETEYRGPAFFFPEQLPPSHRAELLGDRRRAPREGPFAWLREADDASRPIALVRSESGDVASVCYSARATSVVAEAGVRTLEQHGGHGFARMAVIAWAAAVRQDGRTPLYSTQWENIASRALASRLGLICYGEDLHIG